MGGSSPKTVMFSQGSGEGEFREDTSMVVQFFPWEDDGDMSILFYFLLHIISTLFFPT